MIRGNFQKVLLYSQRPPSLYLQHRIISIRIKCPHFTFTFDRYLTLSEISLCCKYNEGGRSRYNYISYQGILVGTVTTQDHSISAIVYAGYSSKSKIQQKNNREVD